MSQTIRPQTRTVDGLSIRYAESEPRDEHALLFSPWPESIYAYEPTWNRLAEHTHLVAIDLPGLEAREAHRSETKRANPLRTPSRHRGSLVRSQIHASNGVSEQCNCPHPIP